MSDGIISQSYMEEVYEAFRILLEKHPEGVTTAEVWREVVPHLSRSHASRGVAELYRLGYLILVRKTGPRKYYTLADGRTFKAAPPKQTSQYVEDPTDPNHWIDDLNAVIGALNTLQERIPGLKVGLLDLSKNLDRLAKVKEILNGAGAAVRRNI